MSEVNVKGYRLLGTKEVPDSDGVLYEWVYEKTQTPVYWLKRDEENKTFAITFRTTPEDSTGVFHILEHTVLNGSRKYPVKDPFVNLLKGSLKTFLNAMTFSDKTMFPVSSRNEKDFRNLMDIYLDAVFHPLVKTDPKIFAQEGWHYEIRDPKEQAIYKDVVFNEMKGALGSADDTILDEVSQMLFPDTCYRFISGGDPEEIPNLTYEQFCAAHDRFYHPSNAGIFLDGDLDINAALAQIEGFLSEYEYRETDTAVRYQAETPAVTKTSFYEIGENESLEEKVHYVQAAIDGTYQDTEKSIAWDVLSTVLTGNNEAPLKKAILANHLGQDVELVRMGDILQPFLIYAVRNTEEDRIAELERVTKETIEQLVHGGLSHSQLYAALNRSEFLYREKKEPSGVILAQSFWTSVLYDGDPVLGLDSGRYFAILKQKIEEGYFENLLKEAFLEKVPSTLIMKPSKTLGQERLQKEKERLATIQSQWSDEETASYIAFNQALDQWQETEDSEENLAKLPVLSLSDVDREPRPYEPTETELAGVTTLRYPRSESGIVYWNLYFALNGMRKEDLSSISLFARLLTELPTKSHTLPELQELIEGHMGQLFFGMDATSFKDDSTRTIPHLNATATMLEENIETAADLVYEILTETVFTKEKVLEIAAQMMESYRDAMTESGHSLSILRAAAHLNASAVVREYTGGLAFGQYLASLLNDEAVLEQFLADTQLYQEYLLTKTRLTLSTTGTESDAVLTRLIKRFPWQEFQPGAVKYPLLTGGPEGIVISSSVAYSGVVADIKANGGHYEGALRVLSKIATFDWLWNEVRSKGGAYGTGFTAGISAIIQAYSYRDPDPMNAVRAAKTLGQFIMNADYDEQELSSYIIGTIADGEPLQSPLSRILSADARWFAGITYEDRRTLRHEILSTNLDDLKRIAAQIDLSFADPSIVVTGPKEILQNFEPSLTLIDLPARKIV